MTGRSGIGVLVAGFSRVGALKKHAPLVFNRNMLQNGVDTLSKKVDAFLSKSSKFYLVRIIYNVQILLACGTKTY